MALGQEDSWELDKQTKGARSSGRHEGRERQGDRLGFERVELVALDILPHPVLTLPLDPAGPKTTAPDPFICFYPTKAWLACAVAVGVAYAAAEKANREFPGYSIFFGSWLALSPLGFFGIILLRPSATYLGRMTAGAHLIPQHLPPFPALFSAPPPCPFLLPFSSSTFPTSTPPTRAPHPAIPACHCRQFRFLCFHLCSPPFFRPSIPPSASFLPPIISWFCSIASLLPSSSIPDICMLL